jgi:hypothetical protein
VIDETGQVIGVATLGSLDKPGEITEFFSYSFWTTAKLEYRSASALRRLANTPQFLPSTAQLGFRESMNIFDIF